MHAFPECTVRALAHVCSMLCSRRIWDSFPCRIIDNYQLLWKLDEMAGNCSPCPLAIRFPERSSRIVSNYLEYSRVSSACTTVFVRRIKSVRPMAASRKRSIQNARPCDGRMPPHTHANSREGDWQAYLLAIFSSSAAVSCLHGTFELHCSLRIRSGEPETRGLFLRTEIHTSVA